MFLYHSLNVIIVVLVYVDDIVITGNSNYLISKLIQFLIFNFALKDLGNLHYFLCIEAIRTKENLFLTQTKYIKDLLQQVQMTEAKHIATPTTTKQLPSMMVILFLMKLFIKALLGPYSIFSSLD